MSYSHFTAIERGQLDVLHRLGWSTRAIGQKLCRHHSSVAHELKRNQTGNSYSPEKAQSDYQERREHSKPNANGLRTIYRNFIGQDDFNFRRKRT